MNKTTTYYQPEIYYDDGTNIGWYLPEELDSFDAFATEEDCEEWLENNDYDIDECIINEYHDDDIEDVTILDGKGNVIEINQEI